MFSSFNKLILFSFSLLLSLVLQAQQNELMNQQAIPVTRDSVEVTAGEWYKTNGIGKFFLGNHYRGSWTTPIKVPVIDFDRIKGGVEILGQGGGMQTYSLKLKGNNGKLYSLRSIQKDPTPVMPRPIQNTVLSDLVQDQISASHPYGAFIIPPLAKAAEIYYTQPRLYYLNKDSDLGKYKNKFGGMLMMLEEDVDEDWSDVARFGYTKNAVSSESVWEELMDENESYVDQNFIARARLFDMLIGDWDRHEGQWRWAELKDEDKRTFYRPVPEDRDNAFFKFDGFLPWWVQRKWAIRSLQKFTPTVRDIKGINFNARYFDRKMLNELTLEEWKAEAYHLQDKITDSVIDEAINEWPKPIRDIDGDEIKSILKSRRALLVEMAEDYYKVLAKEVDVFGSDEDEYFEIRRLSDDSTEVKVFDLADDEKDELLYSRRFSNEETDEVRIYGFGGEDRFQVDGDVRKSVLVRIIGGEDDDHIIDKSKVNGLKKHTVVYDLEGTKVDISKESKLKISNSLDVNRYDPRAFRYGVVAPLVSFGFNSDDGLFIGGGVLIRKEGFRKRPFSAEHSITANVSTISGAWNFRHQSELIERIGDADIVISTSIKAPNYSSNFFGLGNETEEVFDADFYNYRLDEVTFAPALRINSSIGSVSLGPAYQYFKIDRGINTIVNESGVIDPVDFGEQHYGGFMIASELGEVDSESYPEDGVMWKTNFSLYDALGNTNRAYGKVRSSLSLYATIHDSHTTFATRIGGAHNVGDAPFFLANTLGGNQGIGLVGNMRGLKRDRFSGQSSFYQNLEIRQKLGIITSYAASFLYGVNVLFDYGRVWQPGESSDLWHSAYGGGVWTKIYFKYMISATYSKSDVDNLFNLQLSLLF